MTNLLVDWCIMPGTKSVVGAIDELYPFSEWKVVDSIFGFSEPRMADLVRFTQQGAEVMAYGGDGTWYALRRKGGE